MTMKLAKKKATQKKLAKKVKAANPIARWGKYYRWKVTANQLHTFDEVALQCAWESDYGKRGPLQFDITFPYRKELFQSINIAKRINAWEGRLGKTGRFYIGKKALGHKVKKAKKNSKGKVVKKNGKTVKVSTLPTFRLTNVDVSGVQQVRGTIVSADVKLTFTETRKMGKTLKQKRDAKKKAAAKKKKAAKKKSGRR